MADLAVEIGDRLIDVGRTDIRVEALADGWGWRGEVGWCRCRRSLGYNELLQSKFIDYS